MTAKSRRILIDARFFGSARDAGLGVYTEELVRHLVKLDKDTRYYLLLKDREAALDLLTSNVEPVYTDIPHYSYAEQFVLPNVIRSISPDLVHFTNFNAPVLGPTFRNVVTVHDLTLLLFPGRKQSALKKAAYRFVMQQSLRRANKVIAISEYTKQDVVTKLGIDEQKIEIVYEGVPSRFKPVTDAKVLDKMRAHFHITSPFILYVGAWRKHKNLVNAIRAFHLMQRRDPKNRYQFVLVGKRDDKYFPEIPALIKSLGLKDQVLLAGYVADEDIPLFYSAASCYIAPAFYEGFGIPPLEAMKMGLPVIASNTSCLPEVLGPAAEYFDPSSVEEMAEKMGKVMSSFSLRRKMAENGQKWVKRYSYSKMARETLAVYDQALQE